MPITFRRSIAAVALACLATSYGCETVERSEQPAWVQVQILDLSTVEGKWEGLMRRTADISSPASEQLASSAGMVNSS